MNKFLVSLTLNANALDMYGEPAADGTRKVMDLQQLPPNVAMAYYKQITELMDEMRENVKHYTTLNEIAVLEAKLKELKSEQGGKE